MPLDWFLENIQSNVQRSPFFYPCKDIKDLQANVHRAVPNQKLFQAILEKVQSENDEEFFVGNEIKENQEGVQKKKQFNLAVNWNSFKRSYLRPET